MEFETWNLGLLRVFLTPLTVMADEVEILLLSFFLGESQACTVLPDIALLARYAMGAVVLDMFSWVVTL